MLQHLLSGNVSQTGRFEEILVGKFVLNFITEIDTSSFNVCGTSSKLSEGASMAASLNTSFCVLYMLAVHLFPFRLSIGHFKKCFAFQADTALYICNVNTIFNIAVFNREIVIAIIHKYGRKLDKSSSCRDGGYVGVFRKVNQSYIA